MKKILFTLMTFGFTMFATAQTDRYTSAMKKNLQLLDSAFSDKKFAEVINNFERIGAAEKTQWLPYYYAAYATIMEVMVGDDKSKSDQAADKAEALIGKAEEASGKENSETAVLKSMIATTRLMVDPQSRWMKYGVVSMESLARAKELDPKNPRPYFLEGQSKMYTPEAFGGGKAVAKPILQESVNLFETFKPESELHPSWGSAQAKKALQLTMDK